MGRDDNVTSFTGQHSKNYRPGRKKQPGRQRLCSIAFRESPVISRCCVSVGCGVSHSCISLPRRTCSWLYVSSPSATLWWRESCSFQPYGVLFQSRLNLLPESKPPDQHFDKRTAVGEWIFKTWLPAWAFFVRDH